MTGTCALCARATEVTRHHLIPRCRHGKRPVRERHTREELLRQLVVPLCRSCHKQVHALTSERELARDFDTVEKLRAHPKIAEFVAWIRSRPPGFHAVVRKAKR